MNKVAERIVAKATPLNHSELYKILKENDIDLPERDLTQISGSLHVGNERVVDLLEEIQVTRDEEGSARRWFLKNRVKMNVIGILAIPLNDWEAIHKQFFTKLHSDPDNNNHDVLIKEELETIPFDQLERLLAAREIFSPANFEIYTTKEKARVFAKNYEDPIIGYSHKVLNTFFLIAMWGEEADILNQVSKHVRRNFRKGSIHIERTSWEKVRDWYYSL